MKKFSEYSMEELYNLTCINENTLQEDLYYKNKRNYLNKGNERNQKNTEEYNYNCGGFALNTFNWYLPYEGDLEYRQNLLLEWTQEFCDDNGVLEYSEDYVIDVLTNRLLMRDILYMLRQFEGRLRIVKNMKEVKDNERFVAYRIGIEGERCNGTFCDFDIDFHFRWYDTEKNLWVEKCGGSPVRNLIFEEEDNSAWSDYFWTYDSEIIYFALKI